MSDQDDTRNSDSQLDIATSTSQIVSSYVERNFLPADKLPEFIQSVTNALTMLQNGQTEADDQTPQKPAVPVSKSIQADYLVCLECGQKLKSLKRHLNAYHDLTPEMYRKKWNLPHDYPMVSPNYSEVRRRITSR